MKKLDTTMYFITDSTNYSEEEFLFRVEEACMGGVTLIQLREKERTTREYLSLAEKVHEITMHCEIPLIIDDRVDIALAVNAEGVHVGQSDLPVSIARKLMGEDKIVGATAKTVPQALEAYEQGADYLGVGAIYPTTTKVKTVLTSVDTLKDIVGAVPIKVNAIGGLNKDNIHILGGSGIAGICAVSAIMKADDPRRAAKELKEALMHYSKMKTALTIAGSDSSGGAGIQADLKTMLVNGVYGMSAITALTAQNTLGVTAVSEVTPDFLKMQLDAVFTDIFPDAVKIGMTANAELIKVIADRLTFYPAKNIVVDPVMIATSGASLISENAVVMLKEKLLPIAAIITPNIPEAEVLSGMKISNKADMEKAAGYINTTYGCAVLLKGGHSTNDANDLLYENGEITWFESVRINNHNTHGTGCTLSSAIASNLAKEYDLKQSVRLAKEYISGALSAMLNLGNGSGPMDHGFILVKR